MLPTPIPPPRPISLIVTTYGSDSYYTHACLQSIARWKRPHHELIVVSHDETPLLRAFLEAQRAAGVIDRLVLAEARHGHTRSFNLALRYARGDVVFNICNDILIGPSLVDDCTHKLRADPQLGMIGWHWYNEGTFWQNGTIVECRPCDAEHPRLRPEHERNIRNAPWFTGRAFAALGGPLALCLCNTAFFGIRRELLDRVGGFAHTYEHYWADDFVSYAVLDQGLDVRHFEAKFRVPPYFQEFQYLNTDVEDGRRHLDEIRLEAPFLESARLLGGGMLEQEWTLLRLVAEGMPDGSTLAGVGVWRGASAIAMLDGMRDRPATFHFIDCFDLPAISALSAQPPVAPAEFLKYIEPYIGPRHDVRVLRANTLDLTSFPDSDMVVVDAGHTAECVAHDARLTRACLRPDGVAAFHDYGYRDWPDVRPEVERVFGPLPTQATMGVFRGAAERREAFQWGEPQPLRAERP